jgi:hypothetical protein
MFKTKKFVRGSLFFLGLVASVAVLASCATSGSSGGASATPAKGGIVIPKATGAIPVDGNATGWPVTTGIAINDDADGVSGNIKLCYDDTHLYIFVSVNGDKPINFNQGKDIWNGNALEILLGFDPNASKFEASMGSKDYQIGLSPGNPSAKISPSSHDWTHSNGDVADAMKVVKTAQGYQMEASIPWSHFAGITPASGMSFAIDFALDEASGMGLSRDGQWIMDGNTDYYHVPSQWTSVAQLE